MIKMKKVYVLLSMLLALNFMNAQSLLLQKNATQFIDNVAIENPVFFSAQKSNAKTANIEGTESFFFAANNSFVTAEANAFLGTTNHTDGGFSANMLYGYTVSNRIQGTMNWRARAYQMIPNNQPVKLTALDFVGMSKKTSGVSVVAVKVLNKNFETIDSTTANVSTTYGYQTAEFANPVSYNDTMFIAIEMTNATDSFTIARTHTWVNNSIYTVAGTDTTYFESALPFIQGGALYAVNVANNQILGYIMLGIDYMMYPKFDLSVTAEFEASVPSLNINLGDSISFASNGQMGHVRNPMYNFVEWNYIVNDIEPIYTAYSFELNGDTLMPENATSYGVRYQTAGTKSVNAFVVIMPWDSEDFVYDAVPFSVVVTDPSTRIKNEKNDDLSVYSNNNQLIVKNNNNVLVKQVLVFNMLGQEVSRYDINNSESFELNTNLKSANYIVRVSTDNSLMTYKMFIK